MIYHPQAQPRIPRSKNSRQFYELHEIAADSPGFVQLMKLVAAFIAVLVFLISLAAVSGGHATVRTDELIAGFRQPPASARPWVYWFIMDGNFSREGITADLEAMRRAGIGGAILMEVDVGIPRGPVKFMSAEWRALFRHAVEEAERLGLELTLNAGPGWTGSGGPWVKPEQSMQHLVASAVEVAGPSAFNAVLPRPQPRKPYFGEKSLPEELLKVMQEFYVDVAVLAVPKTAARLTDLDEKALYLRHPYSSKPGTKPYLPAPADYPAVPSGRGDRGRDQIVDLTGRLQPDGRLVWEVPPGEWTILRFGRTSSGANTRPAPLSGLGLECDKFDTGALDAHFDAFIGTLLHDLGPRPTQRTTGWTMLHIDSWEMGAQNWSTNFRAEFQHRRGYDPLPFLPAYTGRIVDSVEITERFLWDLRQTAQELVVENHALHLKELAHLHGFGLSIEPYDMNPCADLALGAVADVPMCEFWAAGDAFDTAFSCFEAVSIAHTHGRPIIASESFTGQGRYSWTRHPASMKNQADWALCTGINRLVFHRYAHQPWLDRAPGMTMGPYGTQYERTQSWWEFSRPWHEYLSRSQFLLRQGLPVADILYLTPEGAPQVFRAPPSALSGSSEMPNHRGYNFDACDPGTLLARAEVKEGRIVFPDGMSYRVLVLPEFPTMTPALLSRVKSLLEAGAVILGPPPQKSPSLVGYPQCDDEVLRLAREIWGQNSTFAQRRIGRGLLVATAPRASLKRPLGEIGKTELPELYGDYARISRLLADLGVPPDFESDRELRYAHRRAAGTEIYFVSNPSESAANARCTFRVRGKKAELWEPVTGRMVKVATVEESGGLSRISLSLEPHDSVFVVFRPATDSAGSVAREEPLHPPLEPGTEIAGPFQVQFQPGRGAPERITLAVLMDLSKHEEAGVRYFSGTAIYRTVFTSPAAGKESSRRRYLDLGRVEVVARVRLNGRDLGIVWRAPYRLDATDALRQGENILEIEVANLWPNRLIGDQALPPEQRVAWTTRNPFKKDSPLLPSGLIGPVVIH